MVFILAILPVDGDVSDGVPDVLLVRAVVLVLVGDGRLLLVVVGLRPGGLLAAGSGLVLGLAASGFLALLAVGSEEVGGRLALDVLHLEVVVLVALLLVLVVVAEVLEAVLDVVVEVVLRVVVLLVTRRLLVSI